MTEVMRTEYVICDESGEDLDWLDDLDAAIAFAAAQEEPAYVEERVEYYIEKRIVWSSHASMVEADQ